MTPLLSKEWDLMGQLWLYFLEQPVLQENDSSDPGPFYHLGGILPSFILLFLKSRGY